MDLFLANGTTLDGDGAGAKATGHLYRNLGGLKFQDVTEKAGLARTGWGQGVCAADYDNDGDADLFAAYFGRSVLYRNEGSGAFVDVTDAAGLRAADPRWDTGCSWLDYDLDGQLDLVVTSYLHFDRAKVPEPGSGGYCQWKGIPVMCGPRGLPFSRNQLFPQRGGGRFTDVSVASGIAGREVVLRLHRRRLRFRRRRLSRTSTSRVIRLRACSTTTSATGPSRRPGSSAGVALNQDGQEQGGMGVAVADYDEDGHVDIVKTNFSDDVPNVYHNNGDGTFEDRVFESGLGGYMDYVGWGVHLLDVDHDGAKTS
jgi:hypothetical protein